jgi:hypothetical protein
LGSGHKVIYPERVNILSLFSLLLLLLSTPTVFAGNCDCTDDPLANGGCGLKPRGMTNTTPFGESECSYDIFTEDFFRGMFTPLQKTNKESLNADFISKPKKDLINYLSCYRETDQQFCHFKKSLSPYVAYACEITNLPLSVESCLLMKESSFDPKAMSGAGAIGYAQLMPDTMKDLEKCFAYTQTEWSDEIKRVTEEKAAIKDGKLSPNEKNAALKMKDTTLFIYRARRKVRELWDKYWIGTDGNPCAYGKKPVSKGSKGCLKQEMASCYRYAPLLSMLKQTLDATMVAVSFLDEDYDGNSSNDKDSIKEVKRVDGELRVNGMSDMDSALFLTGAYNYGAPGFAKKCGSVTSMKSCIEAFPESHETRQHLQGIRNCAQKGSTLPTQDPYNSKGIKKDCDKKRCYQ